MEHFFPTSWTQKALFLIAAVISLAATAFAILFQCTEAQRDSWMRIQAVVLVCICHGMVLYEVWNHRAQLLNALALLKSLVCSTTLAGEPRLKKRFDEVRLYNAYLVFKICKGIFLIGIVGALASTTWAATRSTSASAFKGPLVNLLTMMLLYYGIVFVMSRPPKELYVDLWFLFVSLLPVCRAFSDLEGRWILNSSVRCVGRAAWSVVYMKSRVSCMVNLVHALLVCWAYSRNPVFDPEPPRSCTANFVASEVMLWMFTTAFCVSSELWFIDYLRSELSATNAKSAVERLLSGLCDTVVRLDPELRIARATPQLAHLLCPSTPMGPEVLDGTSFAMLLATQSDADSFEKFVSSSTRGLAAFESNERPAQALRVTLQHAGNTELSAELFHVHSEGHLPHLIGVRELRQEGIGPDESLFHENQNLIAPGIPVHGAADDGLKPKSRPKSLKSHSSGRSSSSLLSSRAALAKRPLIGLESVQFQIDMDWQLHQYSLCFSALDLGQDGEAAVETMQNKKVAASQLSLHNCLVGESSAPFTRWLTDRTNDMISGDSDAPHTEYRSEVQFRPPTAACASSKVVLCAESVVLMRIHDDAELDDIVITLHFCDVSQIVARPRDNQQNRAGLPVLDETIQE